MGIMLQQELNIKIVSTNGQISLGKEYAGKQVQVSKLDDGTLIIKTGKFIPDNEKWLYKDNNLERLQASIKEAKSRERVNNFEELLANFEKTIEND